MSKVFDALNRGRGAMAESLRPILEGHESAGSDARKAARLTEVKAAGGAEREAQIRTAPLRVAARSPILPFEEQGLQANEQYRILRTKLGQHPRQPRVIAISSPEAGDGKSVSSVNIAGVLSLKSDVKALLLDADLRRSAAHLHLGLPDSPGLTDVLSGAVTLDEAVVRTEQYPNLYVLPSGTRAAKPAELLDTSAWRALCERARTLFRYTIVDTPPVGSVADYELIQAVSDGVILVVRPDHTNRLLCRRALETIPKEKMLGVVLNWIPEWFLGKHMSSGYYYYASYQRS